MTSNCPPGYTPVGDGFSAPEGMVLGRAIVDQGVTAAYWICARSNAGQGIVQSLAPQPPIAKKPGTVTASEAGGGWPQWWIWALLAVIALLIWVIVK